MKLQKYFIEPARDSKYKEDRRKSECRMSNVECRENRRISECRISRFKCRMLYLKPARDSNFEC